MSTVERAGLGMDGNCGFALLGPDLQAGEAEFEEVCGTELHPDPSSDGAKRQAINRAFSRLKRRLRGQYNGKPISYFLGESYPGNV